MEKPPLVAHHVDPGIDREGRYRRVTGPLAKAGRQPRPWGVAQNRGPSQIYRLERVAGRGIIGARRKNSAHLHRPWRPSEVDLPPSMAILSLSRSLLEL
jgi:hypothetical protein